MDEQTFADRLALLRIQKGVSAREMSLAIGQNPSYINRIENQKAFPSMQTFFYICEYLNITPADFFKQDSLKMKTDVEIVESMKKITPSQKQLVQEIIEEFSR